MCIRDRSANRVGMSGGNVSTTRRKTGRALMTVGEWMALSAEDMVAFVANNPPIYGRKIKYDEIPAFAAWSKLQPPAANEPLRNSAAPAPRPVSKAEEALNQEIAVSQLSPDEQKLVNTLLADHFTLQEIKSVRAFG